MSAEDFFNRWARKNEEAKQAREQEEAAAPPPPDPFEGRVPTLDDAQSMSPDGDFSPFMKQGVDESVKRSALKKLFADPHFNIMDGLDIYIDDYTKPDPIPPEMLAMLRHAGDLLNPPGLRNAQVMAMLDADPAAGEHKPEVDGTDPNAHDDDLAQPADGQVEAGVDQTDRLDGSGLSAANEGEQQHDTPTGGSITMTGAQEEGGRVSPVPDPAAANPAIKPTDDPDKNPTR